MYIYTVYIYCLYIYNIYLYVYCIYIYIYCIYIYAYVYIIYIYMCIYIYIYCTWYHEMGLLKSRVHCCRCLSSKLYLGCLTDKIQNLLIFFLFGMLIH